MRYLSSFPCFFRNLRIKDSRSFNTKVASRFESTDFGNSIKINWYISFPPAVELRLPWVEDWPSTNNTAGVNQFAKVFAI